MLVSQSFSGSQSAVSAPCPSWGDSILGWISPVPGVGAWQFFSDLLDLVMINEQGERYKIPFIGTSRSRRQSKRGLLELDRDSVQR